MIFVLFISDKNEAEWLKQDVLCLGRANNKQHFRDCMYDTAETLNISLCGEESTTNIVELDETEFKVWLPTAKLQNALVLGNVRLDLLISKFGKPTKTFKKSHWWTNLTPMEWLAAKRIPGVTGSPVYYHPELVKGGQKYDISYVE